MDDERIYGYLPSKLHGGQEGEVVGGLPALYVKLALGKSKRTCIHTRELVPCPDPFASTSMALAAKSNGTQSIKSLDDNLQRTKILLLGQQGSVSPLLTHLSPISTLPRAEVERPPSSSSFSTTYPRNKHSFSNLHLEQLNIDMSAFYILLTLPCRS